MKGEYNPWLVVLSVVVAVVAEFVALDLASRVTSGRERHRKPYWLIGGALSLGTGIWSMHFIGMLAYVLPIPVIYDLPITAASWALPVAVSALGLFAASREQVRGMRLTLCGIVVGVGIVSMHYSGMEAMRMQPPLRYDAGHVAFSIAIAVAGSIVAVWSSLRLRMETLLTAVWKKAGSALVMGAAISGMHYAAMAGTTVAPDAICRARGPAIHPVGLALIVGTLALAFLVITLLLSAFDAYVAGQDAATAGRLETRIVERTAQLARAHRQIVELEEAERRRIAGELHDRVGQTLTALGINLNILKRQLDRGEREEMRRRLDDSSTLVEETADAISDVMAELRPPMLDDHGLTAALQWFAMDFSRRTGIKVHVHGAEAEPPLPQEVEIALFRIAQEALNNVAKHAHATHVEIELRTEGPEVVMTIADDGVGLVEQGRGHGLLTMRERAEGLGGSFELQALERGVRLTARIPLVMR
jgi:NO-binding membrane sensor protein with MHYT domain/two-component sensor histidine kinase